MTEPPPPWRRALGKLAGAPPPPPPPPAPHSVAVAPPADGSLLTMEQLQNLSRTVLENASRIRCQAVQVDPSTVLCRVLGRYKMMVDGRDVALAPHLMLDGYWEMWTTEFMLRTVKPGMVVLDVGANLGYFSILMAELVGAEGRLIAVEPNPRLAQLAERNLALNGFWHQSRVERVAAGDASGQALAFRFLTSDPKNGRLVKAGGAVPDDGDTVEIAVPGMRIDDLVTGRVDFIKIDVEGAEEQAWAGLTRVLDANSDIIVLMEFNALRCRAAEATLADIAARFPLRELGLDGQVHQVAPPAILERREDTMLVLARGPL
ncbi:FkbM family methyltransferase [Falsiroseomonas ponticola]|uniref:FkbM family methyltransferase n=1 Tax=Falsiroseomonas ponticola TaxID=2786951 RepID=UPI001933FBCA|nr:FkbM family methyltransferase [Roseomonas ponticola]